MRDGICHAIYWYAKANNKYMYDYDKKTKSSYLKYWDVNNLYGSAISQKLPVNDFTWVGETSEFDKDFLKSYNDEGDKDIFLKLKSMFNILKIYITFKMIYPFYP